VLLPELFEPKVVPISMLGIGIEVKRKSRPRKA
jgi:hypothetical protein